DALYMLAVVLSLFLSTDTSSTDFYTLSLHDALPICPHIVDGLLGGLLPRGQAATCPHLHDRAGVAAHRGALLARDVVRDLPAGGDRKSTRLNSSHVSISYAVFCLKKKNTHK